MNDIENQQRKFMEKSLTDAQKFLADGMRISIEARATVNNILADYGCELVYLPWHECNDNTPEFVLWSVQTESAIAEGGMEVMDNAVTKAREMHNYFKSYDAEA